MWGIVSAGEIVPYVNPDVFGEARQTAAGLSAAQLHLVAREAGFPGWLRSIDYYDLQRIGKSGAQALRMPFPSPFTQAFRAEAGFPDGVQTRPGGWSLGLSDGASGERYDTGVTLISAQRVQGRRGEHADLRLPLDIVVPGHYYRESLSRPDRIRLEVGDRQLPTPSYFGEEEAQGLLMVAARFLRILSRRDEVRELTDRPATGGLLRRLTRGS